MSRRLIILNAVAAFALASCSDGVTRPEFGRLDSDTTQGRDSTPVPDTSGIQQRRLIECPTNQISTTALTIGALGGTVAAAGSSITLPAGSLLAGTLIRMTVPASTYMEVDITANDLLPFVFLKPVMVTIDYSRCPTNVTQGKTLSVWTINTQTKALITNMNGANDPVLRRMTFATDHLSAYAIAQ